MKNVVKISRLSLVCVLCAAGFSSAYGAASVRSLGGTGTYSSASNAVAAKSGSAAINSARAGSIRATTGSTAKATGSTGASKGAVRAGSNTARLSVGSYLQGGKTIQGGSSIKNQNPANGGSSSSNSSGSNAALQNQIDALQNAVDALQDADDIRYTMTETDDLLDNKQDSLTAGTGIDITNGVISAVIVDGRQVLLQSDGDYIQWKYDDVSSTWEDLVALNDLTGPQGIQGIQGIQGVKGDKGDPGDAADLTDYVTETEIISLIVQAINTASSDYATAAQGAKADTALQAADLSDYATNATVGAALATKANTADLGALAVKDTVATADIDDASVTKAKLAADVQTSLGKADSALQTADLANYSTTTEINTTINQIVEDAVDDAIVGIGINIDGKADKATTLAGYGITNAMTTAETTAAITAATAGKVEATDLGALAVKDTVATADIDDVSVTKAKLATGVQTSLSLADTALQPGDAPDISGAPNDGSDYVLVMNNGAETWMKVAY